ncbi:iron transporter [Babesia caballi]|uniref:Iron transporter n=1 Tax=Babesia caballi TaxID=5871 RepID=A0AAV4LTW4_BABCB|nr:iron transporter [Babesia caballi]
MMPGIAGRVVEGHGELLEDVVVGVQLKHIDFHRLDRRHHVECNVGASARAQPQLARSPKVSCNPVDSHKGRVDTVETHTAPLLSEPGWLLRRLAPEVHLGERQLGFHGSQLGLVLGQHSQDLGVVFAQHFLDITRLRRQQREGVRVPELDAEPVVAPDVEVRPELGGVLHPAPDVLRQQATQRDGGSQLLPLVREPCNRVNQLVRRVDAAGAHYVVELAHLRQVRQK